MTLWSCCSDLTGDTIYPSTHPETVVRVRDVLLGSQGSTAPKPLLQLLDVNLRQTKVTHVGVKVDLQPAIFVPSRERTSK